MDQKSETVVGLGPVLKKEYYLSSDVRNCDLSFSVESLSKQNLNIRSK